MAPTSVNSDEIYELMNGEADYVYEIPLTQYLSHNI